MDICLAKKMLVPPASEQNQYLTSLSRLYTRAKSYPAYILYECEIGINTSQPSASGGFGDCWQGLFLGEHRVAMKCSREGTPEDVATRVRICYLEST